MTYYTDKYPTEAQTCLNCRHWDLDHEAIITLNEHGRTRQHKVCPCLADAVNAEAGYGAIVMLGPESDCLSQDMAWEPCPEFMAEYHAEQEARWDMAAYYGVKAGIDFPATL
jgi:hypothetical protein